MKLILVTNGSKYNVVAADDVKIIGKSIENVPDKVRFNNLDIPVVDLTKIQTETAPKLSRESVIKYIKSLDVSETYEVMNLAGIKLGAPAAPSVGLLTEVNNYLEDFEKHAYPSGNKLLAMMEMNSTSDSRIKDAADDIKEAYGFFVQGISALKEFKDGLDVLLEGLSGAADVMDIAAEKSESCIEKAAEAVSMENNGAKRLQSMISASDKLKNTVRIRLLEESIRYSKATTSVIDDAKKIIEDLKNNKSNDEEFAAIITKLT